MSVSIQELHQCVAGLFADVSDKSSESVYRAYINRGYYATFHELKKAMKDVGISTYQYNTGTHNNLCMILDAMSANDKSVQKLAIRFRDFLTKRHHADYELQKTITWHDVKQVQKYLDDLPSMIATHIK